VAVADGLIIGFGDYEALEVFDAQGRFLCPGLVDGHLHIESTLLSPPEFALTVASHGTAAVVADPHEIANVLGRDGVRYMVEASRHLPVNIHYMAPSCVPATDLETSGASLDAGDLARMFEEFDLLGLGEMMNFPGLSHADPKVLAKIRAAGSRPIDGHAPLVTGRDLNAYVLGGPTTDHESTRLDEAREKLRRGMHLLLREGSSEHNMLDLLPLVNEFNGHRFSFVSDDRHPQDLLERGHLDHSIRKAVAAGFPVMRAIQCASINTARHFGLKGQGAIAPGYKADLILLDNLENFAIHKVILEGKFLEHLVFESRISAPGNSMNVASGFFERPDVFSSPLGKGELRVIGCLPGQVVTEHRLLPPTTRNGEALADPSRDLVKLAVLDRHTGSGRMGLGFAQGLGLRQGALASSVAHDSHNLIIAGMNDEDMRLAGETAVSMGGGFVAVEQGRVLAAIPLPIAGLMSDKPAEKVVEEYKALTRACESMGATNPFMTLSFLSLAVIPALKLTDRGLVDVQTFQFTGLWTGES